MEIDQAFLVCYRAIIRNNFVIDTKRLYKSGYAEPGTWQTVHILVQVILSNISLSGEMAARDWARRRVRYYSLDLESNHFQYYL